MAVFANEEVDFEARSFGGLTQMTRKRADSVYCADDYLHVTASEVVSPIVSPRSHRSKHKIDPLDVPTDFSMNYLTCEPETEKEEEDWRHLAPMPLPAKITALNYKEITQINSRAVNIIRGWDENEYQIIATGVPLTITGENIRWIEVNAKEVE